VFLIEKHEYLVPGMANNTTFAAYISYIGNSVVVDDGWLDVV
jgi:hypothetical protein